MSAEQLADALPDAIFILNENGKINWWNKAATMLFPTQRLIKDKTSPESLIGEHAFKEIWQNKDSNSYETKLPNYKYITYQLKPYSQKQYLLIIQDTSRTHHLERMRQDFVANVSHELRTPLTVIHGFLELLLDQTSEQQAEIFKQMQQQSTRMQNIIEELLFLSRLENVEHHSTDYLEIDVPALLRSIQQDAEKLSQGRHKFITNIDDSLKIYGINEELHSLFSNLIFNAVKYTPDKGEITICWYKKANHTYFQVTDTGIGIEQKHIPRITERFYRVDKARSSEQGGTGLGLAIAKHVLIHHKAQLEVTSKPGKGSTFTCIFPESLAIAENM